MSRQPFHRSDFTGSEGPGLAKLRAAKPHGEVVRVRGKLSIGLAGITLPGY